jgi:archaellum component FlaC
MTKESDKIENRLSTLETQYDNLTEKISEIKDNHLQHLANDVKELQRSIQAIDLKLAYWSGGIVVAVWLLERFAQ